MKTDFVKVILRRLRLIKIDRNFLVFLIFLAISIGFWFMQAIKEEISDSVVYKLSIVDVPRNVIYTSELPDEVKVNFSGYGMDVLQYVIRNEKHVLEVSYNDLNTANGVITIDPITLQRAAVKKLPKGLRYTSTSPSKIEVYYSNGIRKRVPVEYNGKIVTSESRILCGINFAPDSVDVYAPKHMLDKIKSIQTEKHPLSELEDTLSIKLALDVPHGVKVLPDSVSTTICVDIFTDKTISVPIYSENTPSNKIIRTFPLQAKVTFLVSSTVYDEVTSDDFILVIDYNSLDASTNKTKITLRQSPEDARHIRISPEYVEYVIEQETE